MLNNVAACEAVLATFTTLDLDVLAGMIFDAGWGYVAGAIYQKDGQRARLTMREAEYTMVGA